MDRTILILILHTRATGSHLELIDPERWTLLHWLLHSAPYWVLRGVCRAQDDYGPPNIIYSHFPCPVRVDYRIHGKLHRLHGPAVIWLPAFRLDYQQWYKYGQLHRDGDLPAVIWVNGNKEWYTHGVLHRDGDLPAVIEANGTQAWYKYGKRHRDGDLPAVICGRGYKAWWVDDKLHRDGGPAVICSDGTELWYQNGCVANFDRTKQEMNE